MNNPTILDLRPGDVMFGPIDGPAGALVGVGQMVVAPWRHRLSSRTWWRIRHCATVTAAAALDFVGERVYPLSTGPRVAQAMRTGYEEAEIGTEHWTPDYVWIRPPWRSAVQGEVVAALARDMAAARIPYAFEDYAAIAAHRLRLPVPHLDRFISAVGPGGLPRRAICSQGVDAQLTLAGGLDAAGHVFADGRLAQDVVPSELYLLLLTMPGAVVMRPGAAPVEATGRLTTIPGALL